METIFLDHNDKQFWTEPNDDRAPSGSKATAVHAIFMGEGTGSGNTLNPQLSALNFSKNTGKNTRKTQPQTHSSANETQ